MDRARDRLGDALPDEIADILNLADQDVRLDCGGERVYVSKTLESAIVSIERRNLAIRMAWRAHEPPQLIADRHGISRSMVYKIVRGT